MIAKDIFGASDKEGDRKLDKSEMWEALKRMNINTTKKHALELFNENDFDQSGYLDYSEFLVLVKKLSKKEELVPIFKKYCAAYKDGNFDAPLMRVDELREFYKKEQKQYIDIERAVDMIKNSKDEGDQNSDKLSFFNFISIIYNDLNNSIFDAEHEILYQVTIYIYIIL